MATASLLLQTTACCRYLGFVSQKQPANLRAFSRCTIARAEDCISNLGTVTAVEPSSMSSSSPQASNAAEAAVDLLDIRVGRIIKAWKHPEADSLYIEEVDVGESESRTICSGLVKYVAEDELQGRDVVVLTNLKPRNMKGIKSNGMLLAASDAAHENVELLDPPEGSVAGERIWFGSESDKDEQAAAATPNQMSKKKIWESVQPKLKSDSEKKIMYDDKAMRTSSGLVTCRSLPNANVG